MSRSWRRSPSWRPRPPRRATSPSWWPRRSRRRSLPTGGRGCRPADHELAFARTRARLREADVVVVVGTPLDFRLSFGRFGSAAVVHIVDSVEQRSARVETAASPAGDLGAILKGLASWS